MLTHDGLDERQASVGVLQDNLRLPGKQLTRSARRCGIFICSRCTSFVKSHADPHPGNFLIDEDDNLIAIDFGCIKEIPEEFYIPYFELAEPENLNNPAIFHARLIELEILTGKDTNAETVYFSQLIPGDTCIAHAAVPCRNIRFFGLKNSSLKLAALGGEICQ